jgi:hypothetical protein
MPARWRQWLLVAAAVMVAFLVGTAWQFGRAERLEGRASALQRSLVTLHAESALLEALADLRAGDREAARRHTSQFFTTVQQDLLRVVPERAESLRSILADRDSVITVLARGDSGPSQLLDGLLARYRGIAGVDSVASVGGR